MGDRHLRCRIFQKQKRTRKARDSDVDAVRRNHGYQAPPLADLIYEHTACEADDGDSYRHFAASATRRSCRVSCLTSWDFASNAKEYVKSSEGCILTLGHSCSRTYASYPSCVTAYPLGSRSRMFTVRREKLSLPAPGSAARRAPYRKSDPPLATNRRFPGSHKLRLANPKLSLFRRVRGKSPQTPKN